MKDLSPTKLHSLRFKKKENLRKFKHLYIGTEFATLFVKQPQSSSRYRGVRCVLESGVVDGLKDTAYRGLTPR